MLTLEQFFAYEPFNIIIIIGAISLILTAFIFRSKGVDKADKMTSLLFGGFGFAMLVAVLLAVITTNIVTITITPCAISQGESYYYIADTLDNVYMIEPNLVLKIHMNQPVTVDIRTGLGHRYSSIVNVTGSICKTPNPTCQPYWNMTYYNFSNYSPLGPNDTILNIPPSKFEYL